MISDSIFCDRSEAVGAAVRIFAALETGLKIDGFSGAYQIQSWTGGGRRKSSPILAS